MEELYDVIIIGGGPAGLTAAVYASRANLKTVFIEKGAPGGKMVTTSKIENWPGDKMVNGSDLALRMFDHAKAFSAEYKYGDVNKLVSVKDELKEVHLASGDIIKGKSVVVATGTVERVPEWVEGIHEYEHKGVSYCAICDGPLYKGLPSVVIGSGNSAVEEGTYLASVASKVYMVMREDDFMSEKSLADDIKTKKNVELLFNSNVKSISGDGKLEKVIIETNGVERTLEVSSMFPYVGLKPSTEFLDGLKITDEAGFIKANESCETSIRNIFAIGDVKVKHIRQISTAVNDGAIAGKILGNRLG